MPRLSIFSWDGTDNSSSSTHEERKGSSTKAGKHRSRYHVVRQSFGHKIYCKPSIMLVDKTPKAPSDKEPLQRCVSLRTQRPVMRIHLRVLATSENRDLTKKEAIKRSVRQAATTMFPELPEEHVLDTGSKKQQPVRIRSLGVSPQEQQWLGNLYLSDFRPLKAPFVPDILLGLVISIEKKCKTSSWTPMFEQHKQLYPEAQKVALELIRHHRNEVALEKITQMLTHSMQIATLRAILEAFTVKPLHFNKTQLKRITKRPLYDQFLRPNPEIKDFVREIVIPQTRTVLDTLAFLMIHITHAWEMNNSLSAGRSLLAEIYGPLLISFTERPIIIDRDICRDKTEEAALMEVIMDVCDVQFWNHLGMLKILESFQCDYLCGFPGLQTGR
ncbi:hypothetical protein PHET_08228 [Paragonimus heterotremus]|uniref:Rho-GAP domain-containing protein n=1 Tax=Paragonimus heterotremus TaxID=100268 RepID=A0A8J4SHS0_9TREM|nr:hypothetical protein PHET_08228 [Paragonimus heterotremus]